MKRHLLTLVSLAAATLAQAATPGVDAPPDPGPALALSVPAFESFVFDNGLRVVVAPRRALPLVTVQVIVLAGREADPEGRAGLAAMTASLLTKGARRGGREVDASTLAQQAEALGSTLDSGAGWRSATLGMTVTLPKLPAALALLADVVQTPILSEAELDRARTQALDALRVSLDDPGEVAGLAARRAFWGASVYGNSPTPASLQRLTVDEVRGFHQRHWRPDATVVVLAGDIDAAQARPLLAPAFAAWVRPASRLPATAVGTAAPVTPAVVLVDMPGSGQSGVAVSAPWVSLGAADTRVAEVANTLLGAGFSSRLNQEIRIKRGLSYGAGSGGEAQAVGGMWTAKAQTKHGSAAEVVALMREAALRVAAEAPPVAELNARKEALVGGFADRLQTTGGLASLVAAQVAQGRDLAELARRADEVRAVTPEQVRDFAARVWKPDTLRAVVAGDLTAAGDSLKPLAEGALRLPRTALDLDQAGLKKP